MTNPQSDHLMGMGKKRPALLGEVGGGRSLATTRLYPALFSTVGICRILGAESLFPTLAQSPHVAV